MSVFSKAIIDAFFKIFFFTPQALSELLNSKKIKKKNFEANGAAGGLTILYDG